MLDSSDYDRRQHRSMRVLIFGIIMMIVLVFLFWLAMTHV